ncbi:methyl-accepting chemotaxis protein [Taurinivorans muris]|uniref:Methyl-accepting chemotaxis protein n=1 Tax=Taurinivorans muris TaxID=2787751 RepID=A0ABY5Y099_9BACT|nr:methyl-accepting chemotaxis protein [Desulfovibrionaceae bacterium LT0009]
MKLTTKLLLAFSTTILLIMLITVLSWKATATFDRQKRVLADSENIISSILKADKAAGAAVAANNAELFNEVKTHLQAALDNSEDLLSIVRQEITKEHLHNIQKTSKEYVPLIDNILHLFKQFYATDAAITKIGYKLQDDLANIAEKEQQHYELTGNAENLLSCKLIGESFTNIRLAVANFLISYSDENLAVVKQRVKEAQEKTAPLKKNPLFAPIIGSMDSYIETATPLFEINKELNASLAKGMELSAYNLSEGSAITDIALAAFIRVEGEIKRQLLIAAAFSVLLGVALAVFLSKNVMKQLGADPSDLSVLAERVTNGDYDINDGKAHIGVYSNIINMVEKLKETLQFSQNVLSSMPIPVAVFGSNNKLKYANREMMGLLEITKKMEDCIGETSGTFMYRQENFNTATCKAIATKEAGKLDLEYETHKGKHINVATIAQPLIDAHGDVTDVISVWQDITETVRQNKVIADSYQNMQNIAVELEQVASITSSASEQLSAQIELSENGAQDQADRVATTATALEEMNATVLEIARNAGTTSDSASNVRSEASAGSESMQECVKAMLDVKEESLKLQTEMGVLSEHAQAINEIMNVISDIADQTNLLALNAAIEAARAGEAGRGFAVVADEVRNLAEKTMTSTTDVGNAISAIQKSTADNTRLVVDAVEKIERVTEMVSGAGEALLGIVQLADTTADQVRAIATASEEQSATSEEITQSVDSINNIAKETTNNMQEARKAVNEMVNQTHILSQLIEQLQSQNK